MTLSDDDPDDTADTDAPTPDVADDADPAAIGDEEDEDDAEDLGVTFYGDPDGDVESLMDDGVSGDGESEGEGDDDISVTFYGDDDVESLFDDDSDADDGSDDVDPDDLGVTFYGSDVGEDPDEAGEARDAGSTGDLRDCVKVGLADFAVADDHRCLSTSGLGSCIGVTLHDRDAGVYGLVHFMLPYAYELEGGDYDDAKFADTGIDALVSAMRRQGADPGNVEAKIAGGSTMVDFSDPEDGVGRRNIEAIREVLAEMGVEITGSDVGGDRGRTIRYDPTTAELEVRIAHGETIRI